MKKIKCLAAVMAFMAVFASYAQETEGAAGALSEAEQSFGGAENYYHFGLNKDVTFFNGNADTKIISLGIFTAEDKNICGIQASLFWNNVENRLTGYQTGMVSRAGKAFAGVQYSVAGNMAGEGMSYGAQLAYGFNIADAITGAQVSFGFNKATTVRGVQIGLVNVSDDCDATFGLVNIVKNGVHDFGAGYDSNENVFVQIQEGGKNLFTNIGVAAKLQDDFFNGEYVQTWIGLGSRDEWGPFSFDVEFLWKFIFCEEVKDIGEKINDAVDADDDKLVEELAKDFKHFQVPHLRFTVNLEPVSHFSVFCSAGVDIRTEDFNDEAFIHQKMRWNGSFTADDTEITLYPVISAGIKIR